MTGAKQWMGAHTDIPVMGSDGRVETDMYCQAGDMVSFKLFDTSEGELIDLGANEAVSSFENLMVNQIGLLTSSDANVPMNFSLGDAYPNPFNPVTNISIDIPVDSNVSLDIYDISGRKIESLVDMNLDAGSHTYSWDAANQSSGIYFIKFVAGEYVATQKITLMK